MTDLIGRDLRYALRRLGRSPAFTAIAVLTLGLGIGANTAIFSVVNAVLLRRLPYHDPATLVMINERRPEGTPGTVAFLNFRDWRDQGTAFESMTLFRTGRMNLAGRAEPERVDGALVSADFFRVLGVTPVLGRHFASGEDQAGKDRVVVIGHELWRRRFGGDRGVVGQPVVVDGRALTVIGVAPAGLRYPGGADLWTPISHDVPDILENRGLHGYSVIGRLRPGVGLMEVASQMDALAARLAQEYPSSNKGWGIMLRPLHQALVQDVRPTLLVLLGAVGFVLLIASANVASMMLARTAARRRELSIHTALGATRWRLVHQLLIESAVLALLGGALGLLLAVWGADALLALAPADVPAGEAAVLDPVVLGFTLAGAMITSLVFGVIPAVQTMRQDLGEPLRDGGRGSAGVDRQRARRLLVVGEIALSLLLLIGAGLMVRSFLRLQSVDSGFNPEGVVTARLSLPRAEYTDTGRVIRFYETLVERAGDLPGVGSAAAVSYLPLGREGAGYRFLVEGRTVQEPHRRPRADFNVVTPGYLATLQIPLLQGRDLGRDDRRGAPDVVLVNQTLARQFWPGQSPLGQRLTFGEPEENAWLTVVGVVADVQQRSLTAELGPQVYAPEAQVGLEEMSLLVRTAMDPGTVARQLGAIVRELDPAVPLSQVQTMGEVRAASISTDRFRAQLLGGFAVLALTLAAIGIYGVISYGVTQRAHEIGIRMALGARRAEILRLVVADGMATVAVGIAIGVVAAVGLSRYLASLLYAVEPHDPTTFAALAILIFAVALAACLLPARRAVRVDPVTVLRAE